MADWQAFLFEIFNIFAHNFKTNRDRDFVFVLKVGFLSMAHLVVIFGCIIVRNIIFVLLEVFQDTKPKRLLLMMQDSKWPTGSHLE